MNTSGTYLASAARTATPTKQTKTNRDNKGIIAIINVTAVSASPSVVFTIQGYDPASQTWYTILASAAITGTGQTVLRVHPDLTASPNLIAKDFLPDRWAIDAVHADSDSITYSVGYILVD